MTGDERELEIPQHSYFVPMVDMLAGVVFVLVILLTAMALVSRPQFQEAEVMQSEINRIENALNNARANQRQYIEPRRLVREAMTVLLDRLRAHLAEQGFSVTVLAEHGRLQVLAGNLFVDGGSELTSRGAALAKTLGTALSQELPCFTAHAAEVDCSYARGSLLEAVILTASTAEVSQVSSAQSVSLLASMSAASPQFLSLEAPDGYRLVGFANKSKPAGASTPSVDVDFRFQLPTIP